MINVETTDFVNSNFITVQMSVPKEEWEKIQKSEEWRKIINSDIENENQFKSLHIDLEKKIFLLNGKPMDKVNMLRLEANGTHWSLILNRDELYEAPLTTTFIPEDSDGTKYSRLSSSIAPSRANHLPSR